MTKKAMPRKEFQLKLYFLARARCQELSMLKSYKVRSWNRIAQSSLEFNKTVVEMVEKKNPHLAFKVEAVLNEKVT